MDSRYQNIITTLAKRLRPFMLSVSEGAMNANEWDNIILIVADGGGSTYYPTTAAGLTSALGAASSGDLVWMPPCDLSDNFTIPAGVELVGSGSNNSILTGTVTNNGKATNFKVVGNLVNTDVANFIFVECSSGRGIEQTTIGASLRRCLVSGKTGCAHMYYITEGRVHQCLAGGDVKGIGIYVNGSDVELNHSRFYGQIGGQIENINNATNCQFRAPTDYDGLYHTTGSGKLINCGCLTDGGTGKDINLGAGGLTFLDVGFTSITGESNISFSRGDRGNYSVEDYHAADIEAAALLRHLPSPVGEDNGDIAYVDSENWIIGSPADAGISGDDEKVGVSANDTTPGYLNGKLVAGDNITLTEGNDGGDETLTIAASTIEGDPTSAYWEPAVEAAGEELVWTDGGDIVMIWIE